ncbi:AAC(3) family N-acetyltransferase [Streptomyces chartreusis]|uniref:AAC(3) family N-acetyltransferase n=1 Tax=Streptomyces chartreusis TaxID=1969 RepID=UPI003806BE1A
MTGSPSLAEDLVVLGLRPGATVLAHASLRRVGAGADAVLAALRTVLGDEGTLVTPTFTAGYFVTIPAHRERIWHLKANQAEALPWRTASRSGRHAVRSHGG